VVEILVPEVFSTEPTLDLFFGGAGFALGFSICPWPFLLLASGMVFEGSMSAI
jgi:hypothetical protein